MPKKLKVWGTQTFIEPKLGQQRCVVATYTQKRAAELLRISTQDLRTYGSETGNPAELALALSKPGVVFASRSNTWNNVAWHEVKKEEEK